MKTWIWQGGGGGAAGVGSINKREIRKAGWPLPGPVQWWEEDSRHKLLEILNSGQSS